MEDMGIMDILLGLDIAAIAVVAADIIRRRLRHRFMLRRLRHVL